MPRGRSVSLEPEELTAAPRRSTRLSRNLHVDSPTPNILSNEENKPTPVRRTRRSLSTQSDTSDGIILDKDLQPTRRSTRLTKDQIVKEKLADLATPRDKENTDEDINKPRRSTRSMSKSPTAAIRVTPTKQKKTITKRRLSPVDKHANKENILEVISETEEIHDKVSVLETNNNENKKINSDKKLNTSKNNLNVSELDKIILYISDDEDAEKINVKTTEIIEEIETPQENKVTESNEKDNQSEIINIKENIKISEEKLENKSENMSNQLIKSKNIVQEINILLTAIETKAPENQLTTESEKPEDEEISTITQKDDLETSQNIESSTEKLELGEDKFEDTNSELKLNISTNSPKSAPNASILSQTNDNTTEILSEEVETNVENMSQTEEPNRIVLKNDSLMTNPKKIISEAETSSTLQINSENIDFIEKNNIESNESFKKPDLLKNTVEENVNFKNENNSEDETESNISIVGSTSPDSKEKSTSPEKPLVVEVNEEEQDYNLSLVNDDGNSYSPIGKSVDIPLNLDLQLDQLISKTNLKLKEKESLKKLTTANDSMDDMSRKRRWEREDVNRKRSETDSPAIKKKKVASKPNLIQFSGDDSNSDSYIDVTSSDEEHSNEFVDDQAMEGSDEDTPSEDSNAIIDHGESIGSTSTDESYSDEASLEDFVINDDFVEDELLSGNEDFLDTEPPEQSWSSKKPKRIIKSIDSSDEESSTGNWSTKAHKNSPSYNQISIVDSDNDSISKKNGKLSEQIENEENLRDSEDENLIKITSEDEENDSDSEVDIINLDSDVETESKNLSKILNVENESEVILKDFCDLEASEIEKENLVVLNEVNREIAELKNIDFSITEALNDSTLSESKKKRLKRNKSKEFNKSLEILENNKRKSTSASDGSPDKQQKTPIINENSSGKKKKDKSEENTIPKPVKTPQKSPEIIRETSSKKKLKNRNSWTEEIITEDITNKSSISTPLAQTSSKKKLKNCKSGEWIEEPASLENQDINAVNKTDNITENKKSKTELYRYQSIEEISPPKSRNKHKKNSSYVSDSPIEKKYGPSPHILKLSHQVNVELTDDKPENNKNTAVNLLKKSNGASPLANKKIKKVQRSMSEDLFDDEIFDYSTVTSAEKQKMKNKFHTEDQLLNEKKSPKINKDFSSTITEDKFMSSEEKKMTKKKRSTQTENENLSEERTKSPKNENSDFVTINKDISKKKTKKSSSSSEGYTKKSSSSEDFSNIITEDNLENQTVSSGEKQLKNKKRSPQIKDDNSVKQRRKSPKHENTDVISVKEGISKKKSKKGSSSSEGNIKKSTSSEENISPSNVLKESKNKQKKLKKKSTKGNIKKETSPSGNIENEAPRLRVPKEKKERKISVKELINKFEKKCQSEKMKNKTKSFMNFLVETDTKARATVSELNDITPKRPITKRGYVNPSQSGSTNCSKIEIEVLQYTNLNNLSRKIKKKEKKQKYSGVNMKLITASLAGQTTSTTNFKEEFLYGGNVKRVDSTQMLKMRKVKN